MPDHEPEYDENWDDPDDYLSEADEEEEDDE
jgi:hypothetical protein